MHVDLKRRSDNLFAQQVFRFFFSQDYYLAIAVAFLLAKPRNSGAASFHRELSVAPDEDSLFVVNHPTFHENSVFPGIEISQANEVNSMN